MADVNPSSLIVPGEEPLSEYAQRFVEQRTDKDLRALARLPNRDKGMPEAFDPRLAYEIALEMGEPSEVFAKHGYDADAALALAAMPAFQSKVKQYREEIVAGGISFKLKARVQAEDLLAHSYDLATDPEAPASVRADLIKWTAAVAGLGPDPSKKGEGGAASGAEFRLNITFTGAAPQGAPAIDVTPTSKEVS